MLSRPGRGGVRANWFSLRLLVVHAAELTAARARIVAAADETTRRIERDLHDGAQLRLVTLALPLRAAQQVVPPDGGTLSVRSRPVKAPPCAPELRPRRFNSLAAHRSDLG